MCEKVYGTSSIIYFIIIVYSSNLFQIKKTSECLVQNTKNIDEIISFSSKESFNMCSSGTPWIEQLSNSAKVKDSNPAITAT